MASLQTPFLRPFYHPLQDSSSLHSQKTNKKRNLKITHNNFKLITHQEDYYLTSGSNNVNNLGSIVDKFMSDRSHSFDCKQVHGHLVKLDAIDSDYAVGSKLVLLYMKNCELLDDARKVFDEMSERTYSLYAAVIGLCSQAGRWVEVFSVLGLMILDEMLPDMYLVPTIFRACGAVMFLRFGQMLHGFVVKKRIKDLFVGNSVIDFYSKCGELECARCCFDTMGEKDVVSWTALVSAYMDCGLPYQGYEIFQSMRFDGVRDDLVSWNVVISGFARNGDVRMAVWLMEEMQRSGLDPKITTWNGLISGCVHSQCYNDALNAFMRMLLFHKPNAVTLVSILSACMSLKDLKLAETVHGYALKTELCRNVYIQGSLIDTYGKCGRIDCMEKVFDHVKNKNIALWNAMIAGYVISGKIKNSCAILESMRNEGFLPDEITYNTLVSWYARIGDKNSAYMLISEMVNAGLKPNIVSFNVLVSGFQQSGLTREALKVFRNMQSSFKNGFMQPNHVTVTGALAACADLSLLLNGKEIHGFVMKNGFESNVFVSSALVDMYGKCHDMSSATKVFDEMENRTTVVWNSLMSAYIHNVDPENALKLIPEMVKEGAGPNLITLSTVLPACRDLEDMKLVRSLHGLVAKSQFLDLDDSVADVLIDMYRRFSSTE